MRTRLFFKILVFLAPFLLLTVSVFANEAGNPSFESALGGTNAAGNWNSEAGRGISVVTAADAPDGNSYLRFSEATTATFSFTFQIIQSAVHPGDMVAARAQVRQTPDDADDRAEVRIEFQTDNGTLITDEIGGLTAGDAVPDFTTVEANARAPAGTSQIVLTLRIQNGEAAGAGTADFDAINLTINGFPIDLGISVTKNRIPKGGASFVTVNVQNITSVEQGSIELIATIPNGLNLIDSATRLNGAIPQQSQDLDFTHIYTIGTLGGEDNKTLSFLIAASPGASIGRRYTLTLYARANSDTLSQTRSIPIQIIADPFFDEGTIIGKVFDDRNENGVQDEGEFGISKVRLATEEGIVILTDPDGKYHIPGVSPGRHVVKIDGHTLPNGTKFVTEEAYLVKITDGLMQKVDFAVKLPESKIAERYQKELAVVVSQGSDFQAPRLKVQMNPDILRIGQGLLEAEPVFKIDTNYLNMISGWHIDVYNEVGDRIWSGYGLGPPPAEAPWSGHNVKRKMIEPGNYSYRLVVKDEAGHEDWTPLQFFRAVSKLDSSSDDAKIEIPSTGFSNIQRDGKRSIPTTAKPTMMVRGQALPGHQVEVNGQNVNTKPDGTFETEFFTEPGMQSVFVKSVDPEGKAVTYQEEVDVKDTTFFMVALGEEEAGNNFFDGNLETVGRDEKFHQGFYQQGKFSYYLKGKIKGKFLVTSHYDTSRDPRQQLFTNLDPEAYYPVYGDDSQINYEARDTQQRLYLLVEMNRSFLKWGSFETAFDDTELSTYNRTLSGLKIHHEVLATTPNGDSKRGVTVFTAKANQLADHNEFAGTGGSLYYLRNKNVVEGSEKIKIEIRDQLQGMTLSKKDLVFGTDYEVDYPQGRIILRTPLSSAAFSDSILSNSVLDGNQVYLIVDYEFESQDLFGDQPAGVRGYTYMGDHIKIGGTALREQRQDRDYDLRGIDTTIHLGKNTRVSAEYAQSKDAQVRNAVSYNGGITFKNITTGDKEIKKENRLMDGAWLVKAESKPFKSTDISAYAQKFQQGFSNAGSASQKGDRKAGFEVKQKFGEHLSAKYRADHLENRLITNEPEIFTQTIQGTFDYEKYLAILEYRNENFNGVPGGMRGFEHIFEEQEFKDGFGAKLGYRLENGWLPYFKGQVTGGGKPNTQYGGGVEAVIKDKGTVRVEQMTGKLGDSARIGFETQTKEGGNIYSHIESSPKSDGIGRAVNTTIGSSQQVSENSRVYSERQISTYRTGDKNGNIVGYNTDLSDQWKLDVSGERSRIRDLNDISEIKNNPDVVSDILNVERTAGALQLSYQDNDRLRVSNRFEARFDRGNIRRYQWLTAHELDWKISQDYRFKTKLNQSMTTRTGDPGNRDASFTELNIGVSYRPVKHNRLNIISRYTWMRDFGLAGQFENLDFAGVRIDETSQILGLEGIYDFSRWISFAQKLGYKFGNIRSGASGDWINSRTFLTVSRLNFHVTRKWDIAAEYRIRFDQELLQTVQDGILLELDREILEYIRFGIGYNFTDFDDDLRNSNSYRSHGFFTRVSGKF